jgi:mannose-6-phosphate isomerase class I
LPDDAPASIILGYSQKELGKYSTGVTQKYQDAAKAYDEQLEALTNRLLEEGYRSQLEQRGRVIPVSQHVSAVRSAHSELKLRRQDVDAFYNYLPVGKGDVIAIEAKTLHALGPGVQVIEPQIPGDTQSTDDFDRLRYRSWWRKEAKGLDLDTITKTKPEVGKKGKMELVQDTCDYVIERFPGGFEKVGLGAHLVTFKKNAKVSESAITSFHELWVVEGKASVMVGGNKYGIPEVSPGEEMLFIPATAQEYEIHAAQGTRVVDIFVP